MSKSPTSAYLEGSDDSTDSDFLNSSLSMWEGPISAVEPSERIQLDLHTAASLGKYDNVRDYINDDSTNLNTKNKGGWTALMYASYIGHDTIVNLLLDASVDVNISNHKGLTALSLAASCGNESVCYFLKESGAELESRDKKNWTALFHATFNGHQNIVKLLLDSKCNINAVEPRYGFTPLMQAAFLGHEIIVQCLLQHGANTHLTSRLGETARSLAMKKGYIKIVSQIDSSELSQASLRAEASLGKDDHSSSEDEELSGKPSRFKPKKPSISEGPNAFSKIISKKQPADEQRASNMAFDSTSNLQSAMENLEVSNQPSQSSQLPSRIAAVVPQVAQPGDPKDIRELLQQLGLLKYEPIFEEQEINLEIFLTLSVEDLKEIGIKLFGPRRKMTNFIESWHKNHDSISVGAARIPDDVLEQMQQEIEVTRSQLNEAYKQLTYYHQNIKHYEKELEHEKNIRVHTESYLLAEKAQLDNILRESKDTRLHCAKGLKCHGKVKAIQQILRLRHEENAQVGVVPSQLQETLNDEATKAQVVKLTNLSDKELWDMLQMTLTDASKSTAMAILNIDKILNPSEFE